MYTKEKPEALGDYWFSALEDKLAAYKFSTAIGLKPPEIYGCYPDNAEAQLASFVPDAGVEGFVVRATDLHSNFGIYVLPTGFGGREIIRDMTMTAADIIADLKKMGAKNIVIEEYVGSANELPMEFKFHMFNGKLASINVVANRGSEECACKYRSSKQMQTFSLLLPRS
jgi:hypothetical protein